jgi:hypothetical protein
MVLRWLEFDQELNTRVIEYFLIFSIVICTPDPQFRSYDFLKFTRLLKFCSR